MDGHQHHVVSCLWHSDEYLTHHQPHLFKSFPRFRGTRRGVFFYPLVEVRTRVSLKVRSWHPFGWRRWATLQGRFVNLCVFFFKFSFLWNTSRQIQLLQSQLYYFKADRIKTCQRIKTRAILIHQKLTIKCTGLMHIGFGSSAYCVHFFRRRMNNQSS